MLDKAIEIAENVLQTQRNTKRLNEPKFTERKNTFLLLVCMLMHMCRTIITIARERKHKFSRKGAADNDTMSVNTHKCVLRAVSFSFYFFSPPIKKNNKIIDVAYDVCVGCVSENVIVIWTQHRNKQTKNMLKNKCWANECFASHMFV